MRSFIQAAFPYLLALCSVLEVRLGGKGSGSVDKALVWGPEVGLPASMQKQGAVVDIYHSSAGGRGIGDP